MPVCLYCAMEADSLTEEHVFPAALGGTLVLKDAVCEDCNHGFSNSFEQKISGEFAHFRYLLRIPDRYGKLPTVETEVEVDGKELPARLLGDETLQLKPLFVKRVTDGVPEIIGEYLTDRQKERLSKRGWEMTKEMKPSVEVQGSFSGQLNFLTSREMFRTISKIAYTTLVFRMGIMFGKSDSFNVVRQFIRSGEGPAKAKLFLNEAFFNVCPQGPHQHSVVLAGRNNRHTVDAIVRIFGGLSYLVELAENYQGADFYDSFAFDAQRGQVNEILVTNMQSEFLQIDHVLTSKDTMWNDQVHSGQWFLNFVGAAINSSNTKPV